MDWPTSRANNNTVVDNDAPKKFQNMKMTLLEQKSSLYKVTYSVVVPVYNSTQSLVELVERLDKVFKNIVQDTYEVILVDDASPNPRTWLVMEHLAEHYNEVHIVQLMRNFGKHGAVICGFEQARGDYIFTLDDDLQHIPEDIPKFIEKRGHDVVIGAFSNKHHSFFKILVSRIKGWFDQKLLGKPAYIQTGPFKLYKVEVVKAMLKIKTPYPFISALMFYATQDIVMLDLEHGSRKFGRSGFTLKKMLKTFSNLLINNSSFLLQVVSVMGVTISILSFLLGIYLVIKNLTTGIGVPGWTSLIVVILVTNGLILFAIGIVGEYLIRIISGVENRPPYIIRKQYHKHHNTINAIGED